jgi:hypothetical protein
VSDDLFYTDADRERAMLVDVIDDGLEGELDDRIPELRRLLSHGEPEERANAARILVSWCDPVGFEALLAWAANPDTSPGVAVNRFTGADATFARLADALRTSQYSIHADERRALRLDAARALLDLVEDYDFERELAAAVNPLRADLRAEIARAAERAIDALDDTPGFDLGTQAASLLMPLAREDDATAAQLAERLIDAAPRDSRMLLELGDSMAAGTGPATVEILRRLAKSRDRAVRENAESALARRS